MLASRETAVDLGALDRPARARRKRRHRRLAVGRKVRPKRCARHSSYQRGSKMGKLATGTLGVGVTYATRERHNSDMRILLAPNAFKGSLSAREVADIAGAQLAAMFPGSQFISVPIADGGDGTLDVLLAVGFSQVSTSTVDALMRANSSRIALQGRTAVIELAEICGLAGVQDLATRPWDTSSFGVGLAAREALIQGAKHLLIALGGSAS
ncbi:MAG: hypothetical protein F2763_04350, partial [Actinobacteria bacterium]|nr:hypothetical protein [Actinomycetota bacterium]